MIENFTVVDKKTGKYPDLEDIVLHEEWAKELCYCDMEGFSIMEDGTLYLLDECGKYAFCPQDRFEVIWWEEPILPNHKDAGIFCGKCDSYIRTCDTYCSSCGRKIDWKSQKVAEK